MSELPTIPFGPVEVTRLIVGGNPFCGNSHVDAGLSGDMRDYHTPERDGGDDEGLPEIESLLEHEDAEDGADAEEDFGQSPS